MTFDPNDHAEAEHDEDYWYKNRHQLQQGQVFKIYDGSIVQLDHGVPGDGTKWRVLHWHDGWANYESTIEPGDLRGLQIEDTPAAIAAALQNKTRMQP